MIGIAQRICRRMRRLWLQKRNKRIEIDAKVIESIGRHGHVANDRSGGREGGRIIKKLIADRLESRIQEAATDSPEAYRNADTIRLTLVNGVTDAESMEMSAIHVEFCCLTTVP